MKRVKWKILIITSAFCLLPILLGMAMWSFLPEMVAIHFDINNNPDNFAPKGIVVFGLPIFMTILQIVCCIVTDFNVAKHGESKSIETATKWIVPVMAVVLQVVTLGYSVGWAIDMRRIAMVLVGTIFIVTGKLTAKLDYIKYYDISKEKARKINHFIGWGMAVMGLLFIISIFLPPIASVVCLVLLIPYTVIAAVYSIKNK